MSQLDDVKKLRVVEIENDEPIGSMEPVALYKPDGTKYGTKPLDLRPKAAGGDIWLVGDDIPLANGWQVNSTISGAIKSGGVVTWFGSIWRSASAVAFENMLTIPEELKPLATGEASGQTLVAEWAGLSYTHVSCVMRVAPLAFALDCMADGSVLPSGAIYLWLDGLSYVAAA